MRIKMKNRKKGGTHVGMMLSFVIFITFITFLYTIIQPSIQVQKSKQVTLDVLKENLIGEVSANFSFVQIEIILNEEAESDCFLMEDFSEGKNFITKVLNKNTGQESVSQASRNGGQISMKTSPDLGNKFFRIYYSEEIFDTFNPSCDSTTSSIDTVINLEREEVYVFESKVLNLIEFYNIPSNYILLKQNFGVPNNLEFSFSFQNTQDEIIETIQTNTSIDIYAERIPFQYINKTASINTGYITIKVW